MSSSSACFTFPYIQHFEFCRLTNFVRFIVWFICSLLLLYLFTGVFEDYNEQNPVTATTYIDKRYYNIPVNIKVCNDNFLDRRKILKDNNSEFNDTIQFLKEAMLGNDGFNDSQRLIPWINGPMFLISSEAHEYFALDLNEFLLGEAWTSMNIKTLVFCYVTQI